MNKQRKVLITTTYNEMGIIIDTKSEEITQPEQRWIPVTERLPEETDSIFARYYGTERWFNSMFRKRSKEVIVTTRFKDGTLHTETAHTNDGKWWFDIKGIQRDVIAWCEMPEPYKGEQG